MDDTWDDVGDDTSSLTRFLRGGILSEQVAEAIEADVKRGRWDGGGTMPSEEVLARRMGVSPTVVRAAIELLVERGVIGPDRESRALQDLIVTRLDQHWIDVSDLHIARKLVDIAGLDLLIERCTSTDLEHMTRACQFLERAVRSANWERAWMAHCEFHEAYVRAGHAPGWTSLLVPITRASLEHSSSEFSSAVAYSPEFVEQHQRIADALEHRDRERLAAALISHYGGSTQAA
jgi:DNA-binding FadR family transcriptional regulator